jgi:MarR family protein
VAAYRLDRSPVYLLYRALQSAEEVFRQSTASGLTPRQLAVLMTVAEHEGTNQIELSALTGIDRTTAAEVVRRLARKRFLQRQTQPVGRSGLCLEGDRRGPGGDARFRAGGPARRCACDRRSAEGTGRSVRGCPAGNRRQDDAAHS